MGMFDDKKYLTGDNGEFKVGDSFRLIEAKINGTIKVNGQDRTEAKLRVQREDGQPFDVYTSGIAIVGAIERMEPGDLPANVVLGNKETRNGNAHILQLAGS